MILYNVTVIIENSINDEWVQWVNETFIPKAMGTSLIASNRLLKVIGSPNEGTTYCLQFIIDDMGSYQQFQEKHSPELMEAHSLKFNNKFVSFSTLMEFINN